MTNNINKAPDVLIVDSLSGHVSDEERQAFLFSIPEIIVTERQRSKVNSLSAFLRNKSLDVTGKASQDRIFLKDFLVVQLLLLFVQYNLLH